MMVSRRAFDRIRILSLPQTSSLVAPIERDDLAPFHIELQSVKQLAPTIVGDGEVFPS